MDKLTEIEKRRIRLLSVPLDIVSDENLDAVVEELLAQDGSNQIVLLDLWDFVRAKGNSVFAQSVRTAALVLPTSKMVQSIAWFLSKRRVSRVLPFDFVIKLLALLERKNLSVYIIGSRPGTLQTAASNVRGSFPDLHIVGRCAGFFEDRDEEDIILAIRKAAPSLILAGNGLPGRDRWPHNHRLKFAQGLTLWCGACIEMFAGKRKRTSRELWGRGLDFVPTLVRNPWRVYRLFVYIWLSIQVLYNRIRG